MVCHASLKDTLSSPLVCLSFPSALAGMLFLRHRALRVQREIGWCGIVLVSISLACLRAPSTLISTSEISTFLISSMMGMNRVSKGSAEHCRPTIVKLCTVWDKHLLLKSFRQHGTFVHQDMSKEERLAASARCHLRPPIAHSLPSHHSPSTPYFLFLSSPQGSLVMFGSDHQD